LAPLRCEQRRCRLGTARDTSAVQRPTESWMCSDAPPRRRRKCSC
jgi:hypothetical protein